MPERPKQVLYSSSVPKAWKIEGRISATNNEGTKIAGFVLNRQNGHYQLTLTESSGFGQMQVRQTEQGLLVDDELTKLSLQEWMISELGWYFPISKLENIIFKHAEVIMQDWQVEVDKYHIINGIIYPKTIRLQRTHQTIKIKLLLQEINLK
ncbi:hypothetical protein BHECKSOX2_917 [Bathymodiolus heckerae thiotrophic gill symbiont]|nr:hypothetical protein BHECKSOX2_917 [Bathymodiolus heckerae thiotrophic gill symbiont]